MYHCQERSEQNTNAVASGRLAVSDNYCQDCAVEAPIRTRKTCWMHHAMDNGFLFLPMDIWGADVYLGP